MNNSKKVLSSYVNKSSKYFVLADNEERVVRYVSAEEIPNRFDHGQTKCMRYIFEVDGVQQSWDRGSRSLAVQMSDIPEGATIGIMKSGEGNKTKYFVRLINGTSNDADDTNDNATTNDNDAKDTNDKATKESW